MGISQQTIRLYDMSCLSNCFGSLFALLHFGDVPAIHRREILPSILMNVHYPLVIQHSHGKWPIEIDGLPINSMVIFHGYVVK